MIVIDGYRSKFMKFIGIVLWNSLKSTFYLNHVIVMVNFFLIGKPRKKYHSSLPFFLIYWILTSKFDNENSSKKQRRCFSLQLQKEINKMKKLHARLVLSHSPQQYKKNVWSKILNGSSIVTTFYFIKIIELYTGGWKAWTIHIPSLIDHASLILTL